MTPPPYRPLNIITRAARIHPGGAFPAYHQSAPVPRSREGALEIAFLYGPETRGADGESAQRPPFVTWTPLYIATLDPIHATLVELHRLRAPALATSLLEDRAAEWDETLARMDLLLPAFAAASRLSREQVAAADALVRRRASRSALVVTALEDTLRGEWDAWLLSALRSAY